MRQTTFRLLLIALGTGFALAFVAVCVPPLLANPNLPAALLAGFVNPYAAGYSLDTIFCWCVLAVWVVYEARAKGIRHGWIALLVGLVPGVASGFALYLLLRLRHEAGAAGKEPG